MQETNKYYKLVVAVVGEPEAKNAIEISDEDFKNASSRLNKRELECIDRRYISPKKSTYKEIAEDFGVGKERVRQITGKAIFKLRSTINRKYLTIGTSKMQELEEEWKRASNKAVSLLDQSDPRSQDIDILQLGTMTYNALKRARCEKVYELTIVTEDDLYRTRLIGMRSVEEIKSKLAKYGLSLKAK